MSDLSERFSHHEPSDRKRAVCRQIRGDLLTVAEDWEGELPSGREKALALTKLEEAMFWANAAVARHQGDD